MKKFAMAAVAALSLSAVQAETCANAFTGFYAGLQAGMASTTGNLKMDGYTQTVASTSFSSFKGSSGKKSFLGGIFAGYGMGVGSCAYVGAEIYANFGNSGNTLHDTSGGGTFAQTFVIKTKQSYNFGAKVRLGYTVSQQAMIFLGLGLESAKTQLNVQNIRPNQGAPVISQSGVTTSVKKSRRGISFAPSVGMDLLLTKNLFVRGEYTYVIGKTIKVSATQVNGNAANPAAAAVGNQSTATIKVNQSQQRFALGLGYKF